MQYKGYDKVNKICFNKASLTFSFQRIAYINRYVVLFSKKDLLRKIFSFNMVLPILSNNRPVFVSRLKLTSPIKNCI